MSNKPSISKEIEFSKNTGRELSVYKYGKYDREWPIVYMLYNDDEVYIGETVDASTRMTQHYEKPDKRRLKNVRIISSDKYNKSAILDLESFLISHVSADTRFKKFQNSTLGQQKHNYYEKEMYEAEFEGIWKSLQRLGLAEKAKKKIENDNLFKYSPYKTLTSDQYLVASHIVEGLSKDFEDNRQSTYIINGGPGTGKTILAIYLMKLLTTNIEDDSIVEDEGILENLLLLRKRNQDLKIGIVISMSNLRTTLKEVFKSTYGLHQDMIYSPSQIANSEKHFDILIVDEAHRLKVPQNMMGTELSNMKKNNIKLGLNKDNGSQLDWVMKRSKHQIIFYDEFQTIKKTDINILNFKNLEKKGAKKLDLETQVRCGKGGQEYINYIRQIFSDSPPEKMIDFKNHKDLDYDFKMFENVKDMTELIKQKNKKSEIGLCRNIAGYSWPWNTKNKIHAMNEKETEDYIKKGLYDIDIEGHKYIWNTNYNGWVSSPNSVNEIGCIHTIQGFDLNYAGVIIGNELKYDKESNKLYVDKKEYYDKFGKNKTNNDDLKQYILNIYYVLLTRGINGTYVYACDKNLRDYLKRYIKTMIY